MQKQHLKKSKFAYLNSHWVYLWRAKFTDSLWHKQLQISKEPSQQCFIIFQQLIHPYNEWKYNKSRYIVSSGLQYACDVAMSDWLTHWNMHLHVHTIWNQMQKIFLFNLNQVIENVLPTISAR